MANQPVADLVDAKYGENKVYQQQQEVMPGAAAQGLPPAPQPNEIASAGGEAPPEAVSAPVEPLGAFMGPSARAGEPVTAGAPLGPGPNSLRLGPNAPLAPDSLSKTLAAYGAADDTGIVAELAAYFDGMSI
jgi:hypothetical protein